MITVGGVLANGSVGLPAENLDELLVDDLDDLLRGVQRLADLLAQGPLADGRDERLTTGSATSASSRARRMSRSATLTSCSVSRPFPRRPLKVAVSRSDSELNTREA